MGVRIPPPAPNREELPMRIRPKIVEGDLVRFSKIGKYRNRGEFPVNHKMVVLSIDGDGIDRSSTLLVKMGERQFFVKRNEVWKTGFNILTDIDPDVALDENAPMNNQNRNTCYVCHMPTKTVPSFTGHFQVCDNANCKWFEN